MTLFLYCRLPRQERARGYVAKDMEFGVERQMQEFKSYVGRRVSANCEKTYINHVLEEQALSQLLTSDQRYVQLRSDVLGRRPATIPKGISDLPGQLGASDTHHMLHIGRKPSITDVKAIKAALLVLLRANRPMPVAAWASPNGLSDKVALAKAMKAVDEGRATMFNAARCGQFDISCKGSGRATLRANFYIQVDYENQKMDVVEHAGIVRSLVRLDEPFGLSTATSLRFALVDLFKMANPDGRAIVASGMSKDLLYPVLLEHIAAKLVCGHPNGHSRFPVYFCKYVNVGVVSI